MPPLKFRTPTQCQNGHFRWYFWEVTFGIVLERRWSKSPCKCPTHELDQGFNKCGDDQRFTGLLDKNGKEIYEGDILKHHKYGGEHIVEWIADSCGFFVGKESWPLTALCCPNIEVIGNIYQNAERCNDASG